MKNNHIPEIRFSGFTGDWELCKLKDISKIHDGTHQTPKYKDSGIKFVSVEDINDIEASNKYISTEDYETQFKNKPEFGDIFMTRITAGVIGATAVMESDKPIAYYVSLALIKPSKKISSLFLSSYISTKEFKKELNRRIIHTAFPKKINLADIGECSVSRPSKEEQAKIGILLKMLDDTIALHQQELTTLKQTKQGFLQKMFPKEGESVPEVRFPGFTDAWEQSKLIEMLVQPITDGPHETPELVEYGIPFISVDAIVDNRIDFARRRGFITEKYNDQCCKKYSPRFHDVYLVKSGSTVGKTAIVETYERFNIWSPLAAMRCGDKSDSYFLYYMLQTRSLQTQVYNKCSHGTQPNLSMRQLEQFNVSIPNIEEQKKIGTFFKNLDNLITLHQRELDVLKETKKAFLQKMFV